MKRGKVRRNYLTYMRGLQGKKARLTNQDFDKVAVNTVAEAPAVAEVVADTEPATEVATQEQVKESATKEA